MPHPIYRPVYPGRNPRRRWNGPRYERRLGLPRRRHGGVARTPAPRAGRYRLQAYFERDRGPRASGPDFDHTHGRSSCAETLCNEWVLGYAGRIGDEADC